MKLVLDDFMGKIQELEGKMSAVESNQAGLQKELSEKSKLCRSLERKVKFLQEKLDYANQERFGDRRQKVSKKALDDKPERPYSDRESEKEDYDGTDGTLRTDSVDDSQSRAVKEDTKKDYFPTEGHPEVVTKFEGTTATPEFLQAIAYEVYVKNVTFGLLHQWLTDMGMTISKNTLHNWLKKGMVQGP